MNSEICINIWFIVDIETELCYNWSIKAYNLAGSDESKTVILKQLAETDFLTVSREKFPTTLMTVFDNVSAKGTIPISRINFEIDNNLNFYINKLEKSLPRIAQFSGDLIKSNSVTIQKIPEKPLFVSTILMENEFGEMKPYTTNENKQWFENEKSRIDIKNRERKN
jgi:hypothetical protein